MSVPGETDDPLLGSGEFPNLGSQDLEGLVELQMEQDAGNILTLLQGSQNAGLPKVLVQPSSNTRTEETDHQQPLLIHNLANVRSYGIGNTSEQLETQQELPHVGQKPGRILKHKAKSETESGTWTCNYVRVLCRQVKDFKTAEEDIVQGRHVTNVNWKIISQRLNDECSTTFTSEQVKQKHKEVAETIKALRDMSNLTGSQRWYDMTYKERRRCCPQIKLDLTRDEFDELDELIVLDKAMPIIPKINISLMTPSEPQDLTDGASEHPSKENKGDENKVNSLPKAADISRASSESSVAAKKTKRRRSIDASTLEEWSDALIEDRAILKDIVSEYRQQSSKVDDILRVQQELFALIKNYMIGK